MISCSFFQCFPKTPACSSLCFSLSSFNYQFRIFNHLNSPFNTIMLLSHSGEYPCVCKHVIFAANSQNMKQVRPYQWLRTLANCLRILANFLRSLQCPTVAETVNMAHVVIACSYSDGTPRTRLCVSFPDDTLLQFSRRMYTIFALL